MDEETVTIVLSGETQSIHDRMVVQTVCPYLGEGGERGGGEGGKGKESHD